MKRSNILILASLCVFMAQASWYDWALLQRNRALQTAYNYTPSLRPLALSAGLAASLGSIGFEIFNHDGVRAEALAILIPAAAASLANILYLQREQQKKHYASMLSLALELLKDQEERGEELKIQTLIDYIEAVLGVDRVKIGVTQSIMDVLELSKKIKDYETLLNLLKTNESFEKDVKEMLIGGLKSDPYIEDRVFRQEIRKMLPVAPTIEKQKIIPATAA